MANLPKFNTPIGNVELDDGRKIVFNFFTKREEKILLYSAEADNKRDRINAIAEIVKNCTRGTIDPAKEPKYITELLYLELRAKSIDNLVEFKLEREDAEPIPCVLDLSDITLDMKEEKFEKVLDISEFFDDEKVKIEMHIPTLFDYDVGDTKDDAHLYYNCLEAIYYGDTIITKDDMKLEEFVEWFTGIPLAGDKKIKANFDKIPRVECTLKVGDDEQRLHDTLNFLILK